MPLPSPDRWHQIDRLFAAALERPSAERDAFLREASGGDAAIYREVRALLDCSEEAEAVLGDSVDDFAEPLLAARQAIAPGARLGAYRVIEEIGRGGMGKVYRAERADDQYRQEVAVKLVSSTLPPEEMARRFRIERQVLARLQHPNVATLLDAGVTGDGRPYLVMQYVRGVPITEYADAHRLPVAARLRLFATVCRTVHFAHSNLVVHRDLKPSNILVTEDGQVRLLDFGIAKLLDPEGMDITAPLTEEHLLLTPEHAAPEQILGGTVTTATDVYALGVLLYELLTGTRPFRATRGGGWHRAVCEEEPAPPSAGSTAEAAEARSTRAPALRQQLRGDLDHMALMALRKEPERRYASAEQFAEDVDRHLDGRPVLARRDTLAYRSRKFLRRNRLPVAAAALMLLMLVAATVVTAHQARARAAALAEAEVERDKAEDLAAFMLDVFRSSDPASAQGRSVTARELLDRAAARIDRELGQRPLVQADMKMAIGRAYGALGLYDAALPQFEDALRLRRAHGPGNQAAVAEALNQVGRGLAGLGRLDEAVPVMREALATSERPPAAGDTLIASILTYLARMEIDLGEPALARSRLERAVAIHRAQPVPDGRGLANALRFLRLAYERTGEVDRELPVARAALATAQASVPEDDPLLLNVEEDYGLALANAGRFDSAVAVFRSVLEGRVRMRGPDHLDVSYAHYNIGDALRGMGRAREALDAYRKALDIRERALGRDHSAVSHVLHSYALALADVGELARATGLEERALAIREAAFGERNPNTLESMELLARLYASRGRDREAVALQDRLVSLQQVRNAAP